MRNRIGRQSLLFRNRPVISGAYSIAGKKEGEGPLNKDFDFILPKDDYGEKTWEKAESKMLKKAIEEAIVKSGHRKNEIDAVLSGDLLNQLMSSSFMARDLHIPFLGLYGACSTMAESLLLGSVLVDGGYASNVTAGVSSHYCTAERQFRMPLEHGNQRPPSAQWTATAAGAMVVSQKDSQKEQFIDESGSLVNMRNICIESGTIGKIIDTGIKDSNQMGAAMAPAAVDTILSHLEDTGRTLDYYDLVLTGDLGFIGKDIAKDLLCDAGISINEIDNRYNDCGAMIFEKVQDVHAGGSGCGCSACVYAGYVYNRLRRNELKKVLLISTGALLSTISPMQGESIPGIAHCVSLEVE